MELHDGKWSTLSHTIEGNIEGWAVGRFIIIIFIIIIFTGAMVGRLVLGIGTFVGNIAGLSVGRLVAIIMGIG